uniref:Uncharacterized protein n=1 Tax=Candidatus Kentrum sp. MB TaxID=2138164 RepID=A0A450Y0M5_9GAMM|nr:MAG: hypothetical protein BECKMB1821G_GA0114241_11035 [Candidatus Kentron sp. MB]VFK35085.1 MAG: hypothetical protein BECKMB1821I_GA0114274_10995 [Candidatus Kentron sp. MB]VFK76216.1 MAG: hypothetical protein BECKMB1821H_GA0114242_104620 [Candidatus Kentron sp. MB]
MNPRSETKDKYAKVATVLNNYRVVIDAGRNEGVDVGQRFLLYDVGSDFIDPHTRENLGGLELIKGIGKIIQVQDEMATLETTEHKKRLTSTFNESPRIFQEKRPFESPQVGDRVRFIAP